MKYVIVQRTGFVPYFLSVWSDAAHGWDHLRARALAFDGPTARRISNRLNAQSPAAPIPVVIEVIR